MRRFFSIFLSLILILSWGSAFAREDSFIVVDDEEDIPDPRYQARALMRGMTLEQMVYQLFIVEPEALTGEKRTTVLSDTEDYFARYPVGGVILFGKNIVSAEQLSALTAAIEADAQRAGIYAPFIAVDEEGGAVSRVANKLGYPLSLSPHLIGEAKDASAAREAGLQIAAYLCPLGINLNFAPVADVLVADGPEIGNRSYGSDAQMVSVLAAAMAEGLRTGGIIPCYKHFPGHGSVSGNTHTGTASTWRTLPEMRETEWVPFAAAIEQDIEMIMTSHLVARGLGDTEPASLSQAVISRLLREELGYDGVVVTDALRMSSITAEYKPGAAAVRALQAGADVLLLPSSLPTAAQAIIKAVEDGTLTRARIELSVERILALKIRRGVIQ